MLASPASAQTPPITASFTARPEQPALGQGVPFTATSTGGTAHAWDLDGDGAFDDANGPKTRTVVSTPGLHTVRLRITNALRHQRRRHPQVHDRGQAGANPHAVPGRDREP